MIRGLWVAIGFLTRLPVPVAVFDDPRAQRQSLAWYPLVGILLGVLLMLLGRLLHGAPSLLSAALLLLAWVGLTGALHLDGLADSADAWIGGLGDRVRTLEIMKDPRCGPAGVVALVLVLLLKFAALASLSDMPSIVLLLAPMLARSGLTALFLNTPYVRANGLGSALRAAPRRACMAALAVAVLLALAMGWTGLRAVAAALVVFLLWRRACLGRLDGFTGDTAGALAEMIEAAALVAAVL